MITWIIISVILFLSTGKILRSILLGGLLTILFYIFFPLFIIAGILFVCWLILS